MRLKSGGDEKRRAAARRAEEAGERGAGERREKQNGGVCRRARALRGPNQSKSGVRRPKMVSFSWVQKGRLRVADPDVRGTRTRPTLRGPGARLP